MTSTLKQIAILCITLTSPGIALAGGDSAAKALRPRGKVSKAGFFKTDRVHVETGKLQAHPLRNQRNESHITLNREPGNGFYGTFNRPLLEIGLIRLNAYVDGEALRRLLNLADGECISTLQVFARQAGRESKMVPQWPDASHPDPNRLKGTMRFEFDVPANGGAEFDRTWQAIYREGAAFRVHVETSANRVVDIDMQRRGQNWLPGR